MDGKTVKLYFFHLYISDNIGIIPTQEILHYGDENFRAVFKKYHRYGHTQRMLRNTYYHEFANISGRNRSTGSFKDGVLSIPLQVMRGIPFLLGYISGDKIRSNNGKKE